MQTSGCLRILDTDRIRLWILRPRVRANRRRQTDEGIRARLGLVDGRHDHLEDWEEEE